ncbi:MAG: hypothetical protein KBB88_01145 [Candidatus Pacebacteria bacterium]|nr:hypothetical protein [Candidatus Paceibacterota bacterium]
MAEKSRTSKSIHSIPTDFKKAIELDTQVKKLRKDLFVLLASGRVVRHTYATVYPRPLYVQSMNQRIG